MDLNKDIVLKHYINVWKNKPIEKKWKEGPTDSLFKDFKILEFPPSDKRDMWTYSTVGMSNMDEENPIELHIFSSKQDDSIVELLTVIAHYHQTETNLELWHTINFGRPWQDNSDCSYGLISLPYLDGPKLENLYIPEYDENLKFLWLIPITKDEVKYKKEYGIEALEKKFESTKFNYLDSSRTSVVSKKRKIWH